MYGFLMWRPAWLSQYVLLDGPAYIRAKKQLSKEVEDSTRSYDEECEVIGEFAQRVDRDAIRRHQDSATQRIRSIEDKARANLLGITIGIAVLFSVFDLFAGGELAASVPEWLRTLLLFLFVVSVCYLLVGGMMALEALRLRPVFMPSLHEEATADERMGVVQAVWALKQNERTGLMRTNALSVSFDGIRNGIVCLAVAFVMLATAIAVVDTDSSTAKPVDDSTPTVRVDSVQPTVSTPNRADPDTSAPASHPSVVEDSTDLTEAVDTLR